MQNFFSRKQIIAFQDLQKLQKKVLYTRYSASHEGFRQLLNCVRAKSCCRITCCRRVTRTENRNSQTFGKEWLTTSQQPCGLRRPTWWTVILFRAHTHISMIRDNLINVFWSTAFEFFQNFFISPRKITFSYKYQCACSGNM